MSNFKAVAGALGIDLTVTTDKGSEDSNVSTMQSLMAQQPDGILFDPITQAAGRADARLLEDAKIPGVAEDRLVVPGIKDYTGKFLIAELRERVGLSLLAQKCGTAATTGFAIASLYWLQRFETHNICYDADSQH
ncbi:MAG: hypothetical protein JO331_02165 [Verrucomicrobia bacterium]|nr:hypothetical protein [Verrucomicrobiota bacterium]